jgi:hypothetical protein
VCGQITRRIGLAVFGGARSTTLEQASAMYMLRSVSSGSGSDATDLEGFIRRCEEGVRHQVQGHSTPFLEV